MMLVYAAAVTKIASAYPISVLGIGRQIGVVLGFMNRAVPANPRPAAVLTLFHSLPFSTIFQNVSEREEQQECNHRSDDQQYFQKSLLKSGSHKND